nr:hypothetical protein [Desulfobacter sp.]
MIEIAGLFLCHQMASEENGHDWSSARMHEQRNLRHQPSFLKSVKIPDNHKHQKKQVICYGLVDKHGPEYQPDKILVFSAFFIPVQMDVWISSL